MDKIYETKDTWTYVRSDGFNCNMRIPVKVTNHSVDDLIERIRNVCTRNSNQKPYANCEINTHPVDPFRVYPAQLYAIRNNLDSLAALEFMLKEKFKKSIFRLNGWLELEYENGDISAILPPIIESYTAGHTNVDGFTFDLMPVTSIVCDGLHRMYLATVRMATIQVVDIKDPYPFYYAHPVPTGWDGVTEVDSLTVDVRKKHYRYHNPKDYYRDFNTAFPYVGESRGVSSK